MGVGAEDTALNTIRKGAPSFTTRERGSRIISMLYDEVFLPTNVLQCDCMDLGKFSSDADLGLEK